jgi:hypothetical protein
MIPSKNDRAENVVGKRTSYLGQPEKGCPICGTELQYSEYNFFVWCPKCNIDMPELCTYNGHDIRSISILTEAFLDIAEDIRNEAASFFVPNFGENTKNRMWLTFVIYDLLKKNNGEMGFREFRLLLYKLYADIKEDKGVDLKLPHYWYVDGPHIYLRGLPAVFKLKLVKEDNVYRVFVVMREDIEFNL